MLRSLSVRGFKTLREVERLRLAPLTVLLGPNAAGKSNLLDALTVLGRLATSSTLSEALQEPVRGDPLEQFSFPPGGLPELLGAEQEPSFRLEADLEGSGREPAWRYGCEVGIDPKAGRLRVRDELLVRLTRSGARAASERPRLQRDGERLLVRQKGRGGAPSRSRWASTPPCCPTCATRASATSRSTRRGGGFARSASTTWSRAT